MLNRLIDIIKEDIRRKENLSESDIVSLKKIIKIIEQEYAIDDKSFEFIGNYLSRSEALSLDEKKSLMLNIGLYFWKHNNHTMEEFEIVEENNIEITSEEIERILIKYGFNDEDILKIQSYKKDYDALKKYGNINNMQEILDILKEKGMSPSDFKERLKHLLKILLHSNKDIILKIFDYAKDDLISNNLDANNKNIKERFDEYLGHVSVFGTRTRVLKRKSEKSKTSSNKKDNDFIGTFANYQDNRDFLKKQGIQIKLDSISSLEKSPTVIKNNLYHLRRYGFRDSDVEKALSVLSVAYLEDLMDLAIELGTFDMFKVYPSNYVAFNKFLACRIKYCKEHNISISGRTKYELSGKIKRQNECFDASRGGIEEYCISPDKVLFDSNNITGMISQYLKLMHISYPISLAKGLSDNYTTIDDNILELDYPYTYRKAYLKSIIVAFDEMFKQNELTYLFKIDEKEIIISRYKVLRNLTHVLINDFNNEIVNQTFNNISNILLYCIEKNSLLTTLEASIVRRNVYSFIDNLNNKAMEARIQGGFEEVTNQRLDINRGR